MKVAKHSNSEAQDSTNDELTHHRPKDVARESGTEDTMKEIYRGKLTNWSNGEEDELLSLEGTDCPLAETIKDHMDTHGRYLTVRYWTSDKEMSEDELTEATVMMQCGAGKADYGVAYSEITGYLWTTEELEVGGHDLLEELKSHIGKWLHLEIEYWRAPAV